MSSIMTITEFAKLGNVARNKKLTPEQRRKIASKASKARWKKKKLKEKLSSM